MANGFSIIGLDPGFASIGYAVCVCDRTESAVRRFRVLRMGVISTEKSSKKREVRAADDNVRRAQEISVTLDRLLLTGSPHEGSRAEIPPIRLICAESMSFPRNASTAAKMSMCWGIVAALAVVRELAVVQSTPQEIKKDLCDRKDASKEDIRAAVEKRFGASLAGRIYGADGKLLTRKDKFEHPYDALAATVTGLRTQVVQALWR